MIEPQGKAGGYSAVPVDSAARLVPSYRATRAAAEASSAFDPEVARGRQDPFAPGIGGDGERTAIRAFDVAPQGFADAAFVGGNSGTVPFLAQQIAQEMATEYVTPERAAAIAIGSYRAVPVASVVYDGPQIALDISI